MVLFQGQPIIAWKHEKKKEKWQKIKEKIKEKKKKIKEKKQMKKESKKSRMNECERKRKKKKTKKKRKWGKRKGKRKRENKLFRLHLRRFRLHFLYKIKRTGNSVPSGDVFLFSLFFFYFLSLFELFEKLIDCFIDASDCGHAVIRRKRSFEAEHRNAGTESGLASAISDLPEHRVNKKRACS